jgi:hypothetical protein
MKRTVIWITVTDSALSHCDVRHKPWGEGHMKTSKNPVEHQQLTLEELDGVAGGNSITRGPLVPPTNFQTQTIGHNQSFRTYENPNIKFITETLLKLTVIAEHGIFPGR